MSVQGAAGPGLMHDTACRAGLVVQVKPTWERAEHPAAAAAAASRAVVSCTAATAAACTCGAGSGGLGEASTPQGPACPVRPDWRTGRSSWQHRGATASASSGTDSGRAAQVRTRAARSGLNMRGQGIRPPLPAGEDA